MARRDTEATVLLECQCGQCRMAPCDPTMRYRLECLCFDCRQRALQFAARRPENRVPADILDYERGVDEVYFANGFLVDDRSRELLRFMKLREEAFNTTAVSACCGTPMCGVHPVYEGGSVSVNADTCRVSAPSIMPSQSLLFGCDFPADKYAALLRRRDVPTLFSVYDETDHAEMVAFLRAVTEPLADEFRQDGCVTFEQLCAEKTIEIDNALFEESRRGAP